jgi:hypothetical protein
MREKSSSAALEKQMANPSFREDRRAEAQGENFTLIAYLSRSGAMSSVMRQDPSIRREWT